MEYSLTVDLSILNEALALAEKYPISTVNFDLALEQEDIDFGMFGGEGLDLEETREAISRFQNCIEVHIFGSDG